jgi:hypothetical protein
MTISTFDLQAARYAEPYGEPPAQGLPTTHDAQVAPCIREWEKPSVKLTEVLDGLTSHPPKLNHKAVRTAVAESLATP